MTLILLGAVAGALLAGVLVFLDRWNRKHAEVRHRRVIAGFEAEKELRRRQDANRLRYHRAEADKLIPRFAARVKVTPLTAEQMRTPLASMTLARLYDAFPSKVVEVRRQHDGSWAPIEDIMFGDLPAATYTHVLVDNRLVPLAVRQDGSPEGEGTM